MRILIPFKPISYETAKEYLYGLNNPRIYIRRIIQMSTSEPPQKASKKVKATPKEKEKEKEKKKGTMSESMEAIYLQQYQNNVVKYGPNTAILLQVGKFFEMYDSVDLQTGNSKANVRTLAEICGCSIEPRASNEPNKGRIFWGFPESSLPKFERILLNALYTVVVIVQNKDATGTVTSRTVDHISSPGTYWDQEGGLAIRREEQIMLGIYIEPIQDNSSRNPQWSLATTAFDVMTGKATSTEAVITLINGKPVLDSLQPFWSMYPPAELVVYWCSSTPAPKEQEIRSIFYSFGKRIPVHIQTLGEKEENTVGEDRIRLAFFTRTFQYKSALSIEEFLDISMYHTVRRSLYHLLQFIQDHNPSYLSSLRSHRIWTPEENVLLGNAALEQLAMIATHTEKPNESLLFWLQKASTAMGKRTLRERCLKPITDIDELNERQDRIEALRNADRSYLEQTMKGAFDLLRIYRRFELGSGSTNDLLQLLQTYEKAATLLQATKDTLYEAEETENLTIHIQDLLKRWDGERIRKSREQNTADTIAVGSYHPWARGYHVELDTMEDAWLSLEKEMLSLKSSIEGLLEEENTITWTMKEDMPFTFTTTARRAKMIGQVAKRELKIDITHSTRGSSTTVTLECDTLEKANDRGRKIRQQWKNSIEQQWRSDWREWTNCQNEMLERLADYFGQLDAECTIARVSDMYGYVRPTYIESSEETVSGFTVKDLRHPIIERINNDTSYISHSLTFGSLAEEAEGACTKGGMLLYGVNAAGKSSLGKAIGLSIVMAQCGLPVPASEMTLIPYQEIFTRILGNDNLWAGMSSFVVEMTEFRSILRSAGPRTLVIGDELCAGTETASATAIVAAGIQTLTERNSHFFFATHLHELAELPEIATNSKIALYHLTVHPDLENNILIYDRTLRQGCGSPMYGLEVCRGLDMDPIFLEKAVDIRKRYFQENGKAKLSTYNAKVIVQTCQICGSGKDLETHHIIPQAKAINDRISPGKHKNTKENLVCLCELCHTKHHTGELVIHGWEKTTAGRQLSYTEKN